MRVHVLVVYVLVCKRLNERNAREWQVELVRDRERKRKGGDGGKRKQIKQEKNIEKAIPYARFRTNKNKDRNK